MIEIKYTVAKFVQQEVTQRELIDYLRGSLDADPLKQGDVVRLKDKAHRGTIAVVMGCHFIEPSLHDGVSFGLRITPEPDSGWGIWAKFCDPQGGFDTKWVAVSDVELIESMPPKFDPAPVAQELLKAEEKRPTIAQAMKLLCPGADPEITALPKFTTSNGKLSLEAIKAAADRAEARANGHI